MLEIMDILKRYKRQIAIGLLAIAALAAFIALLSPGDAPRTFHSIDVRLVETEQGARAEVYQEIVYRNGAEAPLEELNFHVYPNAFEKEETAPFAAREMASAYPGGFSPGGVTFSQILLDGQSVENQVEGTVLTVTPSQPLGRGESAKLSARYTIELPESFGRLGATEHGMKLLNAFLVPAVYDRTGWRLDPYTAIGDPFYSDVMDYKVTLRVPAGYEVSASGEVKSLRQENGETVYTLEGERLREFAAVLSKDWVTLEGKVGKVELVARAADEASASAALTYAANAVQAMEALFGPCPYPKIEICAADFYPGGMEYPGLAVIDRGMFEEQSRQQLEYCVTHEVAHQWWYGGVGSDQINEAWLDESLAEYSTLLCMERTYGAEGLQEAYRAFIRPRLYYPGIARIPIAQPLSEFADNAQYTAVVYAKGAAMWHALRQQMGDEAFFGALSRYYKDNLHRRADGEALLDALGEPWGGFMRAWLEGEEPG